MGRGAPGWDKSERLRNAVTSYKSMGFARVPVTTSVFLSAPEELINSSGFSQPLQERILILFIYFYFFSTIAGYLAVTHPALRALHSDGA